MILIQFKLSISQEKNLIYNKKEFFKLVISIIKMDVDGLSYFIIIEFKFYNSVKLIIKPKHLLYLLINKSISKMS
jgi:hypothetical protein